jgi:hypothetical protein
VTLAEREANESRRADKRCGVSHGNDCYSVTTQILETEQQNYFAFLYFFSRCTAAPPRLRSRVRMLHTPVVPATTGYETAPMPTAVPPPPAHVVATSGLVPTTMMVFVPASPSITAPSVMHAVQASEQPHVPRLDPNTTMTWMTASGVGHMADLGDPCVSWAKRPWTEEEDKRLLEAITQVGAQRWPLIATMVARGRAGKQCRERWFNHLCPAVKKGQWTEEEDRIIQDGVQELGKKWSEIVKRLPGRTDNAIKNRFNSLLRKVQRRARAALGMHAACIQATGFPVIPEANVVELGARDWVSAEASTATGRSKRGSEQLGAADGDGGTASKKQAIGSMVAQQLWMTQGNAQGAAQVLQGIVQTQHEEV